MQGLASQEPLTYGIVAAIGVAMIAIARWAARRGGRWESWVALRIGDVLFTETLGAFAIGAAFGGLLAVQLGAQGASGPPRRIAPPGRFSGFDPSNFPLVFGIAAAAVDVLMRVDIGSMLFRGRSPHGTIATYLGSETRVVRTIPAGGYGDIVIRDGMGNNVSVAATADVDVPVGTLVRIIGARGANPVVTPVPASNASPDSPATRSA
jgi:hypothetical protein